MFRGLKIYVPRYILLISFFWNPVAFLDMLSPSFLGRYAQPALVVFMYLYTVEPALL